MKEQTTHKRRKFMSYTSAIGISLIAGAGFGFLLKKRGREKIRMLTAAGELVEVEARHLRKGKKVRQKLSNAELKKWMDKK